MPVRSRHLNICGGGPAGVGLLLQALQQNRLHSLMERGLCVFDMSPGLGSGNLGQHKIASNSRPRAFLELIDQLAPTPFKSAIKHSAPYRALASLETDDFQLPLGGDFLETVGAALSALIHSINPDALLLKHRVEEVELGRDGLWRVSAVDLTKDLTRTSTSRHVALCMGASQDLDWICDQEITEGVTLAPYRSRVLSSGDLVRMELDELTDLLHGQAAGARIAIIGGSHSAFSAASRLSACAPPGARPTIVICHRRPVRFFYESRNEATASGYRFDEPDICPLSGRVNRFSGLRYSTSRFAQSIVDRPTPSDAPATLLSIHGNRRELIDTLESAPVIVAAFGFKPVLPKIRDVSGRHICAGYSADGGLAVTSDGTVCDGSGHPLDNLHAFGLGSGLSTSSSLGGEPSFKGRIDGVWMYQHDVGRLILSKLLG